MAPSWGCSRSRSHRKEKHILSVQSLPAHKVQVLPDTTHCPVLKSPSLEMGRPNYLSRLGHQHHVNQSHIIFICLDLSLFWQLDHMPSGARVNSGSLCNLHWIWFLIRSTTMYCLTNSGEKECGRNIRKKKQSKTEKKYKIKQETTTGQFNHKSQSCQDCTEEGARGTKAPMIWAGSETAREDVGKETESHVVIRKMFTFRGSILQQCCFLFYMYI